MADEDLFEEVASYLTTLRPVFPLTSERPIAWAMRPDGKELKMVVDAFLHKRALTGGRREIALGDLDEIRKRGAQPQTL